MVFAYMAYKSQFAQRASSLIDQGIAFQHAWPSPRAAVRYRPCRSGFSFGQAPVAPQELKGRIEIRDVHFRYSPTDPWVLNGVSLIVEPGEHVAITGPSGEASRRS